MKKAVLAFLLLAIQVVNAAAQSKIQVENEVTFAKLYGYVRYFHPSDEAASLNWNRFAIYGSKRVAECSNEKELKQTLTELFRPIAPSIQLYDASENISFNKQALVPADTTGYKTIAWQHKGVGLITDRQSFYKSSRINRPVIYPFNQQRWGSLAQNLDAAAYRGKTFKLTAKVKIISGTGTGHLWARVNKTDKSVGFFDNMEKRPINPGNWGNFEITGKIDTNAAELITGVFLAGDGELLIDDFTVSINTDGKWQVIYSNTFDKQQTGIGNTGFATGGVKNQPSPDYIYSTVGDAKQPQKYGSIKSKYSSDTVLFEQYPRVGEYINKELGSGLKVIMALALYGTQQHTYPIADSVEYGNLIKELNKIKQSAITGTDLNTRLAGVIISWNIFQHFFPYFDYAKTNWENDLREALGSAYADKNDSDFKRTLQKITAKLRDGHINITKMTGNTDRYLPAIKWEWIQKKLVITEVLDPSINLHRGDVVTAINGASPEDHFKDAKQYISAATPGYLNYLAQATTLMGTKGSSIALTIQGADNAKNEIKLNRTLSFYAYLNQTKSQDTIRVINKDVTYLNIDKTPMNVILSHMDQLQKSKIIICDLRGFPAGNTQFIQYLLTKPDTAKWMYTPYIIYPDQQKILGYDREGAELTPLSPHISAKIIFITDGEDISAAESFMSLIKHYKLATIIGQPTAGTNGVVNYIWLPGGFSINFTGMKVLNLDGTQHHGIGTVPDLYLEKTIDGVRANKDEFLDKAIEMANGYVKQ